LLACRWEGDEEGDPNTFRVVEIEGVGPDGLTVWAYGNSFLEPPSEVDVAHLRRMRLHAHLDGPIDVPRTEFRRWDPVSVKRR
jgi:hypothetical protein